MMIRARENPIAVQAGVLALLMHALFLFLLVFSFNWKHVQPPAAAEVELWDSLPTPKVATPEPEIKPTPQPPPEIKPEPKQEIKPEPEPPPPEPKAEIQVKPKPVEVKKPPKEEPKKPDPAIKKQEDEKKRKDELEKLKKAMLADMPEQETPPVDTKEQDAQKAADAKHAEEVLAASSGVVNEYKARIVAKIKHYVNRQPCGTGKPELTFGIALLPDGHINGSPHLIKSSNLSACDQAVERAILQAQPLPLPPQTELFDQFRNLNINFRPNEDQ
jgi:colicin import membrane protein